MIELLRELEEFLMHQADAEITPEGRVISNDAMRLFDAVQEQIRNFEAGK